MEKGTHIAKATGRAEVFEHHNGCLVLDLEWELVNGEKTSSRSWLTKKNGEVNVKALQSIKDVFAGKWDGSDPYWFMDATADVVDTEADLVIDEEEYKGKVELRVKFVNPVRMPGVADENDRAKILAKYGSKFRALAGGTSIKKPASKPPAKKPAPAPKKEEPKEEEIEYTHEMCWDLLKNSCKGKSDKELEAEWYKFIDKVPGANKKEALDPGEWQFIYDMITEQYGLPY